MPNPQPAQEQRMGRYGKNMRDCCDSNAQKDTPHIKGCPNTRPAADPGEYGELDLPPMLYSEADQDDVPARLRPHLKAAADRLETQAATIARLREGLIDWRNCWLCPVTDFEGEVERLIKETDALIDPDDADLSPNPTSP